MNGATDIGLGALLVGFTALLLPLILFKTLGLSLHRQLFTAFSRMTAQLLMVGLYLSFLFEFDYPAVNLAYVLLMAVVANWSVVSNSGMSSRFFIRFLPAVILAAGGSLLFFLFLVFRPQPLFAARYVIPIAGMILGNSMNRTIVTVERFYSSLVQDRDGYTSLLTMGATTGEAVIPYLRTAYRAGLMPALANASVMGLVSLPGMMTGQILGGSPPMVAIKYQIAIMLAIFAATEIAGVFAVKFSMATALDDYGIPRSDIFRT